MLPWLVAVVERQPPRPLAGPAVNRARIFQAAVVALGVLVPLVLLIRVSHWTPPEFDGALNLQVARNVAHGQGFGLDYGGWHPFDVDIQTSGVMMLLVAGAIRVMGENQLAYHFVNLFFALLLLGAVSWALRPSLTARALGPVVVFLALPAISVFGLGALGEIPVAALSLIPFVLLAGVAGGGRSPYRATALAFGLLGTAITIKVVAVAALPVTALGLVIAAIARPELSRGRLLRSSGALLVVPAAFEVYRLVSLGSFSAFGSWWADELRATRYESGGSSGGTGPGLLEKPFEHLHFLSQQVATPRGVLLIYLAVPFAALGWLLVRNRRTLRTFLSDRAHALAVMLGAFGGLYFVWWLALTSSDRAWPRKILIGFVAVNLLYAILITLLARYALGREQRVGYPERGRSAGAALALVAAGLVFAVPVIHREAKKMISPDHHRLSMLNRAADAVRARSPSHRYYGDGWWAAPAVSFQSHLTFRNLRTTPLCRLDPRRDVLVWDSDAWLIAGPPSTAGGKRRLRAIANFPGAATLFSVGPAPGACPAG